MFIVTDADVDFLAPSGAPMELSAATFHPYGVGKIGELATINILPLRGSREFSGHFFRRTVAAGSRLKSHV